MRPLIVAGTGTGVGKTVVSAMLTLALDAFYWKPIQSGTADSTDTQRVRMLTGLPAERFLTERYVLSQPLSPHRAAELDGVTIAPDELNLPAGTAEDRVLIIESAGGVLVPINRHMLQVELFARWRAPIVLVAETKLGTINHSLLSLEALQHRAIPVLGIVFHGEPMPDTERSIIEFSGAKRLGRLPFLSVVDAGALKDAFAADFDARDFEAAHA